MRGRRSSSRSPQVCRLRRVTVPVPEGRGEDLRQFAQELCSRQWAEPAGVTPEWRKLSPSAELLLDPESGARCAIRDIRQTATIGPSRCLETTRLRQGVLGSLQKHDRSPRRRLVLMSRTGASYPMGMAVTATV
jgi:hypothetical protein